MNVNDLLAVLVCIAFLWGLLLVLSLLKGTCRACQPAFPSGTYGILRAPAATACTQQVSSLPRPASAMLMQAVSDTRRGCMRNTGRAGRLLSRCTCGVTCEIVAD